MTRVRIINQLENNGYIVVLCDSKKNIYSAEDWNGRVLFGTLNSLYRNIFGI